MDTLLGIGLYTYQDAARYTGLSIQNIYSFVDNNERHNSRSTLWTSEVGKLGNRNYLSFRDLTELRAIKSLRNKGCSWQKIREAAEFIMNEFNDNYPLSNGKVRTCNTKIFHSDKDLTSVVGRSKGNYSLKDVLEPLLEELEYDNKNIPIRWYPQPRSKAIVLDPDFSRGKPILKEYGIPTDVVAHAYKVEKNYELISRMYEIPVTAIKTAVEFEAQH